jgi:hypothetical protein
VKFASPASWRKGDAFLLNVGVLWTTQLNGGVYLNGAKVYDTTTKGIDPTAIDVTPHVNVGGENTVLVVADAAGFAGRLVVSREPQAAETLPVAGAFDVQETEDSGLVKRTLPGTFKGLFAVKNDVTVPASWKGARVFLKLDVSDIKQYNSFAINDKIVFQPVAWYPAVTYMDITPWVKFGQPNRLTILPYDAAKAWTPGPVTVTGIRLEKVTTR